MRDARQVVVPARRLALRQAPAVVDVGRDVDGARVGDRRLHVDHRRAIDPVVDAQRARDGIAVPVVVGGDELRRVVAPLVLVADAVLVPALQRAAARRAVVVLAGPLVVEAREVVEHPRADALGRRPGRAALRPQQEVDDRGEAEAGARAVLALVENQAGPDVGRGQAREVAVGGKAVRQRAHRGAVRQVAQVEPVRSRVERDRFAVDDDLLRGHRRTPSE